jgi:PleD family two-component response regulator
MKALVLQKFRHQIGVGAINFLFASDGIEALAMLEANGDIDMVVADINMPRMDGLTLLLGSKADVSRYETLFPGLRDFPRSDQKKALRDAIELARQDPAIMNDPATEQGYLIQRGD